MALFKPFRGSRTSLDAQPLHDGYAYFCTDDGSFHIDYADADGNLHRQQINGKYAEALTNYNITTILSSSNSDIPTSKAVMDAIDSVTADDLGIYVQPNEPTDAVPGDIWIDTINDPSYIPTELPEITEADNGKVLMVVNGKLQLVNLNLSIDANGVVSM